jgi:glycosyltransferase involved in cell wall biosynthesis
MHILHTESSNGWGGQEIRILKEAMGLRASGKFQISFAVARGAKLGDYARKEGFDVIEIDFKRSKALLALWHLCRLIKKQKIDIVNTHSSLDAWLGGLAAKVMKKKVVRTRHLSTPIRGGINARLLYNGLADFVVTTSSSIIPMIQERAYLPQERIRCIATGVDPFEVSLDAAQAFRKSLRVKDDEILVGSVCVVRSWKGIQDLIAAAKLLRKDSRFKWVVVGGGYIHHFQPLVDADLPFIFTGHLEDPKPALAALDVFALLSTANEGISQASLQAAFLKKPLVTTTIGGLPEVCQDGVTGFVIKPSFPQSVAEAIVKLADDMGMRERMGEAGHRLVMEKYTQRQMLEQMAQVFTSGS